MKSPLPGSFSPAPLGSAYSSKSSTPMSPASPMSSHDSPKPSTATSTSSASSAAPVAAKPQLAIKPMAPAAARPLQIAAGGAASPGGSVMAMNSVVTPLPQSPATALSPAAMGGKPPMSITSKEWVIPPRPKPGRKPATDTPPTKRKAQNRAAQRAFRERRAARVGELEDLLEDQKSEQERIDRENQDKIRTLETEVQVLRSRCQMLENLLEKEKAANQAWATKERQASQSSMRSNSMHRNSINSIQPHQAQQTSHQHQQHQHQQSLGHIHSPAPHKLLHGSASSSISSASGRRTSAQPFSISQIISPPDDDEQLTCGNCNVNGSCACADEVMAATVSLDCGKCTLGSKCACLEASINALTGGGFSAAPSDLKRSHSSSSPVPLAPEEKRARHYSEVDTTTEIDFTHMFSRPKAATSSARTPLPSMQPRHQQQQSQQQIQPPAPRFEIPLKERCGFCSDGTYCVCADSMPGVTMTGSLAISAGTIVAQQKTPPPSENDMAPMPMEVTATGAIKLSSMAALRRQQQAQKSTPAPSTSTTTDAPRSKCGPGGPGTCAQCLADPVSGLFCRSLAANFERQGNGGGGCCGGGGAGGGCCKDKKAPASSADSAASAAAAAITAHIGGAGTDLPSLASVTRGAAHAKKNISLSCADAYKTLASHRHFDEATDEISTWLPKLRAAPRHDGNKPGPMEVEAASIMSVLKGFDVRFGK
ncbi:hypothetical protein SBRCBS47491_005883 [Sporothrix bragantina]|uniref:BZIP domain-containing protein n=1 Tax=Sporothrix bragantina TaxID=671064 RepID=A0ABP0C190_9PEZI